MDLLINILGLWLLFGIVAVCVLYSKEKYEKVEELKGYIKEIALDYEVEENVVRKLLYNIVFVGGFIFVPWHVVRQIIKIFKK